MQEIINNALEITIKTVSKPIVISLMLKYGADINDIKLIECLARNNDPNSLVVILNYFVKQWIWNFITEGFINDVSKQYKLKYVHFSAPLISKYLSQKVCSNNELYKYIKELKAVYKKKIRDHEDIFNLLDCIIIEEKSTKSAEKNLIKSIKSLYRYQLKLEEKTGRGKKRDKGNYTSWYYF